MKTYYPSICFLLFILLAAPRISVAQDEKMNSVGPGFFAMPEALVNAQSIILNGEFERFLNEKNSLAVRIEYIRYSYVDDADFYYEEGSGGGVGLGFSYKHYFSSEGYGGFYIAPAVEFVVLRWDYLYYSTSSYYGTDYGNGTSLAICPNFVTGYRFNIGDTFSISPSLMLGYRVGISIEHEGEAEGESGPLGGVGVAFGFRF